MTEPTYPAWIEAAPEPKRTLYKICHDEMRRDETMDWARFCAWHGIGGVEDRVMICRAANHRVLALKRQLRAMKGER